MRNLLLKGVAAGAILAALASTPVKAADILVEPEPVYVPPPLTWTGFYVGIHGGAGWVNDDDDHDDDFFDFDDDDEDDDWVPALWDTFSIFDDDDDHDDDNEAAWLFGAQAGYNWQSGNFVFGLEADVSWANFERKKRTDFSWETYEIVNLEPEYDDDLIETTDTWTTVKVESDWLATIRGRAGLAYDRWLIYVTGGAAFTSVDVSFHDRGEVFDEMTGDLIDSWDDRFDDDSTLWGWTVGVGLEGMITPNLTAKIEYLYVNFNEDDLDFNDRDFDIDFDRNGHDVDIDAHIIRAGLNYKFNW